MDQTIVAQPATFALQVGLAALWKESGVNPAAVIGHSIGEMAAAYTAGALSLEAAVTSSITAAGCRSSRGSRAAWPQSGCRRKRPGACCTSTVCVEIAAMNSSELVTIAGAKAELDRLLTYLKSKRDDVFARRLRVDYAFHTRQMDPFQDELRRSLETISYSSEVVMLSTVTGKAVQAGELNAQYWWRNMREPVMFHSAVNAAIDQGINTFIELGAHPVLAGPVRSSIAARGSKGVVVRLTGPREGRRGSIHGGAGRTLCRWRPAQLD